MQGADGNLLEAHFLGTGWAFPPAFDSRTRGALMVSQLDDVQESLRILMATVPRAQLSLIVGVPVVAGSVLPPHPTVVPPGQASVGGASSTTVTVTFQFLPWLVI